MRFRRLAGRCTVRVVLDANLLVSAIFGGLPARAVDRAVREGIWVSPEVREEWATLADKLAGRLTIDQLTALKARLVAVLARASEVEIRRRIRLCRDPADDAYLSLALAARADMLVTGDRDLLAIPAESLRAAGLKRLTILSPRAFLAVSV